jgi:hypothetical protein
MINFVEICILPNSINHKVLPDIELSLYMAGAKTLITAAYANAFFGLKAEVETPLTGC